MVTKKVLIIVLFAFLLSACAGVPVREAVKVDMSLPVGTIEGNHLTGIRFPFNVSAPSNWKITTEIPSFMEELGYEKGGLESSQLFIYNPTTQSNVQIDFEGAGRHARFDQQMIEWLTTAVMDSLKEEVEKDYGRGVQFDVAPTTPISLKGVSYAAKKYATYALKGVRREQGWIYAFTEPYQIFILYMILGKEGSQDNQDLKTILDSFEVVSKK